MSAKEAKTDAKAKPAAAKEAKPAAAAAGGKDAKPAKEAKPAAAAAAKPAAAKPAAAKPAAAAAAAAPKAKIAIVYYSLYGHIAALSKAVAKGVEAGGAEVKLYQVPETLPAAVLEKMHAPPKDSTVPVISDPHELEAYDGIIFCIPTRFGAMAAQMKAFFDSTGGLWQKGGLVGKTAGIFFSTATQGGGQETTALTTLTQFTHHGMIYIPLGYQDPSLFNMEEIHGGSPYGAGTFAGAKGDRQPSALELGVAESQGKSHATVTSALKRGRAAASK